MPGLCQGDWGKIEVVGLAPRAVCLRGCKCHTNFNMEVAKSKQVL